MHASEGLLSIEAVLSCCRAARGSECSQTLAWKPDLFLSASLFGLIATAGVGERVLSIAVMPATHDAPFSL